jgi:hypothetical protein
MDQDLAVVINSPRGQWEATFPKTVKVGVVTEAAREHFGFEPGAFQLRREISGEILDSTRPLVSYGIEDGETLLLIPEMGSGV